MIAFILGIWIGASLGIFAVGIALASKDQVNLVQEAQATRPRTPE